MRSFLLSKVAIPLHLAFIACYLACVRFGPETLTAYLPLAWFAAGLIEVTLLFPSARKGEEVYDARRRVRASLLRDPILSVGIVGFLFLALQTLNGPRTLFFNPLSGGWEFSPARIGGFPACITQSGSVQGLFWSLLVIPAMLVVGNGMGKKGRTLLLKFLVAVSALLALYGLVRGFSAKGRIGAEAFATLPDPITAGIYFFMHFCVASALYVQEVGAEIRDRIQVHALFIGCVLNFAGALFSLSCLSIALSAAALVLLFIYGAVYLANRLPTADKMRMMAGGLILVGLIAFLHFVAYPRNPIHACTEKILSGQWETPEEKAERGVLAAVAKRMFKANAVHGVGTWGYAEPSCFGKYMADDDWEALSNPNSTPSTCGNDSLQFLAEYGCVGFAVLALPYLIVFGTALGRLALEFRPRIRKSKDSESSSENESRPFTERLPPLAFALLLAIVVPFAISFRFSVFRYPLVLYTWTLFISILPTLIRKPTPA